ncbi:hypothetical protein ACI7RC_06085 [Brevibacillus sp. B_LB10_24]
METQMLSLRAKPLGSQFPSGFAVFGLFKKSRASIGKSPNW